MENENSFTYIARARDQPIIFTLYKLCYADLLKFSPIVLNTMVHTAQVQHRTHSHESICSWLDNHQLKSHFVCKYCWSTWKDGYSQVKWVPRPFSWQLFNHEQIDSCERVRRCAWAVPYTVCSLHFIMLNILPPTLQCKSKMLIVYRNWFMHSILYKALAKYYSIYTMKYMQMDQVCWRTNFIQSINWCFL